MEQAGEWDPDKSAIRLDRESASGPFTQALRSMAICLGG